MDVPTHGAQEERLYVVGESNTYNRGGVLSALREPVVKAHLLKAAYEQEDDADDVVDEQLAAQRKEEESAERESMRPRPIDRGGGMYTYERIYWSFWNLGKSIRERLAPASGNQ